MADQVICPVCKKPVGNDPHEACFEQMRDELDAPPIGDIAPCPACGEDMGLPNPDCKDHPTQS